jgi:hypothetical protein
MRINDYINKLLSEDYQGEHSAPVKEDNAPIYDLTINGIYPEDIYSNNAVRLYGDGVDYDAQSINIIHSLRGRKRATVKIYRAIPDLNRDIDKQIKNLSDILNYRQKYGFFPIKNQTIYQLEDKYQTVLDELGYDARQSKIVEDIGNQITELYAQKQPLKIHSGDWVTIVPQYAKEHGQANLKNNYKILTKTVPTNTLYTDGNSIHEWGYNV